MCHSELELPSRGEKDTRKVSGGEGCVAINDSNNSRDGRGDAYLKSFVSHLKEHKCRQIRKKKKKKR